ncbi:MAG: hypothetical protein ABI595_01270 [Actinomycetota bacterium]
MQKAEFEAEAVRLVDAANAEGTTLRLLGALAFATRCPDHAYLQDQLGRVYTDIDFGGYGKQVRQIQQLLAREGYEEDAAVYVESQGSRLVLEHRQTKLHLDVFLDQLEFCHTVSWNGRLAIDDRTIPLAEMLLQKMQIVEINEKDLIDTIMLLLEYPLGDSDDGHINIGLVADICAKDWGWWRTLTMNLDKVRQMASSYPQLTDEQKTRVSEQVATALERIDAMPKTMGWKLRSRVGDRMKWYQDVGELTPEAG